MTAPSKALAKMMPVVTDPVDIEGQAQANFAFTVAANQSAALNEGVYDVWSDQDCYVKIDSVAANDVTTSTGYLLLANNVVPMTVREGSKIGAIRRTADGTLSFHKVR